MYLQILTALSFYGRGSYQGAVGLNMDGPMAQPTVSKCLRQVTEALNSSSILQKYIKFPQNTQERNFIKERFYVLLILHTIISVIWFRIHHFFK